MAGRGRGGEAESGPAHRYLIVIPDTRYPVVMMILISDIDI